MFNAGYSVRAIQQRLKEEDVIVTKKSLYRLIKKFKEKGVYTNLQRSARNKELTLEENDEATARHLRDQFVSSRTDWWAHII